MKLKKLSIVLLGLSMTMTSCTLGGSDSSSSKPSSNPSSVEPQPDTSSSSSSSSSLPEVPDEIIDFTTKYAGVDYYTNVEISYESSVSGGTKHAMVTLPSNYSSKKKYPVVYLLHPLLMSHKFWIDMCKADIIISNMVYAGLASDMILVSVNSLCNEDESNPSLLDGTLIATTYDKTANELKKCLIPYMEENYSVLANKSGRAVAGASMGGREALLCGFNNQDTFNAIGAFSSTSMSTNVYNPDSEIKVLYRFSINRRNGGFNKILLTIGDSDMMTSGVTEEYDEMMTNSNIDHEFVTLEGGHTPSVWSDSLKLFLVNLFE